MRIFDNPNVNFMKWRWHALILSVLVIGAGLATIISRGGLPLGVDFSGGTVMRLKFTQPPNEDAIRGGARPASLSCSGLATAANNEVLVRLPIMKGAEQGASLTEEAARVEAALRAGERRGIQGREQGHRRPDHRRGPEEEGHFRHAAVAGGHPGLHLVPLPADVRGGRHCGHAARRAGDGRVPDVVRVRPVAERRGGAAHITGYSVNDTIVIFDRVRENQRSKSQGAADRPGQSQREPDAVAHAHHGGHDVPRGARRCSCSAATCWKGLSFTLLVGILTGTYSTVFIASAIAIVLSPKQGGAAPARKA